VRLLDLLFITLVAAVVAIAVPVIGALLIFAFLIGPAAAAQALARGMARGVLLAMLFGLLLTWAGLAAAYYIGYPASTWIASLSFALYVAAQALRSGRASGAGA
jgi:zinc/manganese transport system permease protein